MNKIRFTLIFAAMLGISSLASAQGTLDKNVMIDSAQGNFVRIVSMEPDNNVPLIVGEKVNFKFKIEYQLNDAKASISLVIQKAGTDATQKVEETIATQTKTVSKGSGTIELAESLTVPDTGVIQIFTPLIVDGQTQTQVVDIRVYEVKKR